MDKREFTLDSKTVRGVSLRRKMHIRRVAWESCHPRLARKRRSRTLRQAQGRLWATGPSGEENFRAAGFRTSKDEVTLGALSDLEEVKDYMSARLKKIYLAPVRPSIFELFGSTSAMGKGRWPRFASVLWTLTWDQEYSLLSVRPVAPALVWCTLSNVQHDEVTKVR